MQVMADRPEAASAIRSDLGAIFVSMELVWGFFCQPVFCSVASFSFFLSIISFFVRVRRETGKKSVVRVHHGEGVAIHIDPESCADAREGIGEALTGERIGQAIEP